MKSFIRILLLLLLSPLAVSAQTFYGNHYTVETDGPFSFANNQLIWNIDQSIASTTNFGDPYSFSVFAESGYQVDLSATILGSYQFASTTPPLPGYASITLRFFNGDNPIRYSVDNTFAQNGSLDLTFPTLESPKTSIIENLLYGIVLIEGQGATAEFQFDSFRINFLVSAVPEPFSYAMLGLGLGVLGFANSRRGKGLK